MCNAVLHAMDLANVAYPWGECVKWARRVGTEFAEQVAKEKVNKIPVSVFMDVKGDVQLAKLQVGFVNYVIMPFFEIVTHHIEEFKVASIQCRENVLAWGKVADGSMVRFLQAVLRLCLGVFSVDLGLIFGEQWRRSWVKTAV
jgi:hypothetical protein